MRILIVGGVAAGASAATKARRSNQDAEIVLFERGEYVSFANCGLPYHIGNVITDRDELLLVTPDLFRERFDIDVRLGCEVTHIDAKSKTIAVVTPDGEATEPYDKLILATGGEPIRPELAGASLRGVYTVFTVPDADGIIAALAEGKSSAVVIGGGFIGLEVAENLMARGVKTALLEKLPRLMPSFDIEFSDMLGAHLIGAGLDLRLNTGVSEITGKAYVEGVKLDDGTELPCELVILAVGVRPNTALAKAAGLRFGDAGDMVESPHLVSGKNVRIPLAGSAVKQGRVAGANAAGSSLTFRGVLGTSIIKVGELTAARTGLSEDEAKALNIPHRIIYLPGSSNATYYPGAEPLMIKLIVEEPTGKLLGAQAVGGKGVDKRIDVLATALYAGLTVFDLENLDLAYAPPYSSARDPVIMGGMVAANLLRGNLKFITPAELPEAVKNGAVLLDVRTDMEHAMGHIDGAVLLPVDELRTRFAELDIEKEYVVYCAIGYRAYNACLFLQSRGYKVTNLTGGWRAYLMRG